MDRVSLDPYVIDTLLPDLVGHDRHPSAFLVYLYLSRWAEEDGAGSARRSLREIGEGTGLSRRAVQDALKRLARRRLVEVRREGITGVGDYHLREPWRSR